MKNPLQADLRDSAGSVPDFPNKASIAVKPVARILGFPSAC